MHVCQETKKSINILTSAGDVDGPLEVLLSEDEACCSGFGLCVLFRLPLHPHGWRDEVPFLGPDRQKERDGMPNVQRCFSILRGRHECFISRPVYNFSVVVHNQKEENWFYFMFTEHIYSSTALGYNYEVFVFYMNIYILCHFIILISEAKYVISDNISNYCSYFADSDRQRKH